MKHSYDTNCPCTRCTRERNRRAQQGDRNRPLAHVMLGWTVSRNARRARIAREYWDAYESGRPMGDDNY